MKISFNTLLKIKFTDELKILDSKIKGHQAQYDLSGEAAKISVLSSKNLDRHEYLTGEDLGYKPSVVEKAKFEHSSLDIVLTTNTKSKTYKNEMYNKDKQDKYLVYNSQDTFVKFKDANDFKELSFDFMNIKLNELHKKFNSLKLLIYKQMKIKT